MPKRDTSKRRTRPKLQTRSVPKQKGKTRLTKMVSPTPIFRAKVSGPWPILASTFVRPLWQQKGPWPNSRNDGLKPEDDAAHDWDWRDAAWWDTWALPTPFGEGHYTGVDLTLQTCKREEGWELYLRRILTTDDLLKPNTVPDALSPNQKYFALYNVLTGVLRLFIHFDKAIGPPDQFVIKSYISVGGPDNELVDHGLFHHIGAVGTTDLEVNDAEHNQVLHTMQPIAHAWIVADYYLSYDELDNASPLYLNAFVLATNQQAVTLSGNFTAQVSLGPIPNNSLIHRAIGAVQDIGRSAMGTSANMKGAGETLERWGMSVNGAGYDGSALVAAGAMLLYADPAAAAAAAGYSLVSNLVSLGSNAGGAHFSTLQGTVTLDGQISDQWSETRAVLCAREASDGSTDYVDIPYLFKKFPQLGLGVFSLTRAPKIAVKVAHGVTLGGTFWMFGASATVLEDVRSLLKINPASFSYFGVHVDVKGVRIRTRRYYVFHRDNPFAADDVPDNIYKSRDATDDRYVIYTPMHMSGPDAQESVELVSRSSAGAYEPVFDDVFIQVAYVLSVASEVVQAGHMTVDTLKPTFSAMVTYRCTDVAYTYVNADDV